MDKSEKYIEMCRQAIEIQKLWKRNDGDFTYTDGDLDSYPQGVRIIWHRKMTNSGYHNWYSNWYMPRGCIWLPRQDQLQDILSETCTLGYFISGLHEFFDPENLCPDADSEYPPCDKCSSAGKERRTMYETMEQWWLAFIMSELFTKKWNGSEWVYDSSLRVPDHAEDAQK